MTEAELKELARESAEKCMHVWYPVTFENGIQVDTLKYGVPKHEAETLCLLARGFGENCRVLHERQLTKG